MRNPFLIVLLILAAFLLAVWSPWSGWNISLSGLFGVEPPPELSGLQVSSLAGTIEVFVDGVTYGRVSAQEPALQVSGLTPGDHQVKLERISEVRDAYYSYNKLVGFVSGVDVVIAYELGPSEQFSEGHVIFVRPNRYETEKAILSVSSPVVGAEVRLDDAVIGYTPLGGYEVGLTNQHRMVVSAPGYDTQEFTILPANQEERDKLQGLEMAVEVDLFRQPIQVRPE